jgi:hypothetical protein
LDRQYFLGLVAFFARIFHSMSTNAHAVARRGLSSSSSIVWGMDFLDYTSGLAKGKGDTLGHRQGPYFIERECASILASWLTHVLQLHRYISSTTSLMKLYVSCAFWFFLPHGRQRLLFLTTWWPPTYASFPKCQMGAFLCPFTTYRCCHDPLFNIDWAGCREWVHWCRGERCRHYF